MFFRESSYSVVESNGSVQLELVLNSSSSSDITVNIFSINDSASGEHYNIISSSNSSNSSSTGSCSSSSSYMLCIYNMALKLNNEWYIIVSHVITWTGCIATLIFEHYENCHLIHPTQKGCSRVCMALLTTFN